MEANSQAPRQSCCSREQLGDLPLSECLHDFDPIRIGFYPYYQVEVLGFALHGGREDAHVLPGIGTDLSHATGHGAKPDLYSFTNDLRGLSPPPGSLCQHLLCQGRWEACRNHLAA